MALIEFSNNPIKGNLDVFFLSPFSKFNETSNAFVVYFEISQ